MLRSIFGLVLLIATAAPGLAKDAFVLEVAPSEQQSVRWVDGSATVEDTKPGSKVVFSSRGIELPGNPSTFVVVVFNQSDKPIIFGPENVAIELSNGQKLATTDPSMLETKLRRDIKRRKALAILGGAFSAQGANGDTSGTFSYNGSQSDGTYVTGTGTYTGTDPVLVQQQQQAAREQAAGVNRAIEARKQNGEQALDWMARKTTIDPGQAGGGWLAFDIPSALKKVAQTAPVSVVVKIGSEEHRFGGFLKGS
jgi:hypothetical protein